MKEFFHKIWHYIWTIFLNGLLTILPLALTIALFTFVVRMVNRWLVPLADFEPEYIKSVPGVHVIIALGIIFFIGVLIKLFVLAPLIHLVEGIFFRIPLMSQVYSGIKQLVHAFTIQDEMAFKKVVMIPFPGQTVYSLGFLTSEVPADIIGSEEKYFHVFVPTTPNPTSGFLVQVAQKDLKIIDLTRQEAMSLIISGGIIKPDRFRV